MKLLKCLFMFFNFYSSKNPQTQRLINQLILYMSKSKIERLDDNLFDDWERKIRKIVQEVKYINL